MGTKNLISETNAKGRISLNFNYASQLPPFHSIGLLLVLSICPAFLFSCSHDAPGTSEPPVIILKGPAGITDEGTALFYYGDGPQFLLDSFSTVGDGTVSPFSSHSTSAATTVAAIRNLDTGVLSLEDFRTLKDLSSLRLNIKDDNPSRPVMAAISGIDPSNRTAVLELRPRLAEIRIESIRCDFSGKGYEGKSLENIQAYLTYVRETVPLFGEDNDRSWIKQPYEKQAVFPGISFFTYPHGIEKESLGAIMTRLVIEGTLDGQTCYYPIPLADIRSGMSTSLNLVFTDAGTGDPDIPVSLGQCLIEAETVPWREKTPRIIRFVPSFTFRTRSSLPPEDLVSDWQVLVFNRFSSLEYDYWSKDPGSSPEARLQDESDYTVLGCANLGYRIEAKNLFDVEKALFHLSYPDEFGKGIPMSCRLDGFTPGCDGTVALPLERLMARITVEMDYSGLDEGIEMVLRRIHIGNCPRSTSLFGTGSAQSENDFFPYGFFREGPGPHSLYSLENSQLRDSSGFCSWIEMELDYKSDCIWNPPGEYLIYRFYIGDEPGNYDVIRNSSYHFTVRPEGDGLSGDGWKVDKSALKPYKTGISLSPAAYNECRFDDSFHLRFETVPPDTPVEIEALAHDDDVRVRDLYDYDTDPDGHGVVLKPKKTGTALVWFHALDPVCRDTLAMVVFLP